MRITVVASMRNEGPFIVEWVTWYRMLGFTDVVVVTNNCTDRSPGLLDAFEAARWLHHIRCDVAPGLKITHRKLAAAYEHKAVRRADWLLVCDVDEFLVIHKGDGSIHALIGQGEKDAAFAAMGINWRVFGSGGVQAFEDRPVHQQFVLALPLYRGLSQQIKMLHRQPRWFRRLGEHGPMGWNLDRHGRDPAAPGMGMVNARGKPVKEWNPDGRYMRHMPKDRCTHKGAQMNHYMLRSEESFSLKAGTLAPVTLRQRYTDTYQRRANALPEPDSAAFRYAEAFAELHAQAMQVPGVARLHALCCADHLRLIAEKAGRDHREDPRWHAFMAAAEAAGGGKGGEGGADESLDGGLDGGRAA